MLYPVLIEAEVSIRLILRRSSYTSVHSVRASVAFLRVAESAKCRLLLSYRHRISNIQRKEVGATSIRRIPSSMYQELANTWPVFRSTRGCSCQSFFTSFKLVCISRRGKGREAPVYADISWVPGSNCILVHSYVGTRGFLCAYAQNFIYESEISATRNPATLGYSTIPFVL